MKCFYHRADLDGHCSGAIVKLAHPECVMIGIDYADAFPWDCIEEDETVVMVDFSLTPITDMFKLAEMSRLIWIDHHDTAIKAYKAANKEEDVGYPEPYITVLKNGVAGCELTWAVLRKRAFPHTPEPIVVNLLGRYDVWDHAHQTGVLELQHGLRLHDTHPNNMALWHKLLIEQDSAFIQKCIDDGKILLQKQEKDNATYAGACAFTLKWEGFTFAACNRGLVNSKLVDSFVKPMIHSAVMLFVLRSTDHGCFWKVSMYSLRDDMDVGEIAKKYGGGGHKGAAGFECKELPFDLPMKG